ncbi:MAG: hypothetical protein AAB110_07600 [Candidatus Desantisbacteria bacterium]
MTRLILASILIFTLSATSFAEVSFPMDKFSKQDYDTLSSLNEDTEVDVRLVCSGNIEQCQTQLWEAGVTIIGVSEDRITIRTTVDKLNKIASSDWIILIEKEGMEQETGEARAPSLKSNLPLIIHAQIICDNPPIDYQSQIQNIGAKIIGVEGNVVDIESANYEILNNIGHLNYVMQIDSIRELPALDVNIKFSEDSKWILDLPDEKIVEVILIPKESGLLDILENEMGVEIIKGEDTNILIKCSIAKLKELAGLNEVAVILAGDNRKHKGK